MCLSKKRLNKNDSVILNSIQNLPVLSYFLIVRRS